jgi:hypothetical protein
MNWLRVTLLKLFSERDNTTPDVVRVVGGLLALVGGVVFLFLSIWNVVVNKVPFAYESYGIGLGLVITALGGAVAAKALTERKP